MPLVGEPYTKVLELEGNGDTFLTPGSGNSVKVTLLTAYESQSGLPANDEIAINPEDKDGDRRENGPSMPGAQSLTPLVGSGAADATGFSELYMTDDHGIYINNESGGAVKVVVQGMRVA